MQQLEVKIHTAGNDLEDLGIDASKSCIALIAINSIKVCT